MTPQPSQKPDVKAIRRQFENMKPVDKPVPYNSHKRTSIPTLLGPPVQKTHHARTPPPTAPINNSKLILLIQVISAIDLENFL